MSGNKDKTECIDESLAFEYVAGTLRGNERALFKQALSKDQSLQERVQFWEEQLMNMSELHQAIAPQNDLWEKIEKRINATQTSDSNQSLNTTSNWTDKIKELLPWGISVITSILLVTVLVWQQHFSPGSTNSSADNSPNSDYVAVLTNTKGEALLTALTTENGKSMWLKWEPIELTPGSNAQLWAVSKRDGQTRPIAVFENAQSQQLPLNETVWRLITDSSYLLLTEEEPGGSAIDEPSEILLAKGFCVRFSESET